MKKFLIISFCFLISLFQANKIVKAEENEKTKIESSEAFKKCMGDKTKEDYPELYQECYASAAWEVEAEKANNETPKEEKEKDKGTVLPEDATSNVEKPTFTENEKENEKKYADKFEELVRTHRIEELTKYIKEKLEATKELKAISIELDNAALEYKKAKEKEDHWYAETVLKTAKEELEKTINKLKEKFPGVEGYSFDDFTKDYLELTAAANVPSKNGDVPEVDKYGKTEKNPNKSTNISVNQESKKPTQNTTLASAKPNASTQNVKVASNTKKLPDAGVSSGVGFASVTSALGVVLTLISKKK